MRKQLLGNTLPRSTRVLSKWEPVYGSGHGYGSFAQCVHRVKTQHVLHGQVNLFFRVSFVQGALLVRQGGAATDAPGEVWFKGGRAWALCLDNRVSGRNRKRLLYMGSACLTWRPLLVYLGWWMSMVVMCSGPGCSRHRGLAET